MQIRQNGRSDDVSTRKLAVLLYHHIGDGRDLVHPHMSVAPSAFERQVKWMKARGFVALRAADCAAWLRGIAPLPRKAVMLTFDDAYEDTAAFAFPVLEAFGFPATAFVVSRQLGGWQSWDSDCGQPLRRLMSESQVRNWSARGIEFGSHTRTHADLRGADGAAAEAEISGSRDDLRALALEPACFAYPYGHYDEAAVASVSRHYELGFTCDEGLNDRSQDRALLRRTVVHADDTLLDLEGRLTLGFSPLRRVRTGLRLRSRLASAARAVGASWR